MTGLRDTGSGPSTTPPGSLFARLRWWWLTRRCECHWQEPYGPVVMAGCPLHD